MSEFYSSRTEMARRSFGNSAASKILHMQKLEPFNSELRRNFHFWKRSVVFSAWVGLSTSTLLLGAIQGVSRRAGVGIFSNEQLLNGSCEKISFGAAAIFGIGMTGGFALSLFHFLTLSFERLVYDLELKRELWEIENDLSGEIKEVVDIYEQHGLTKEEALEVTKIFSKNPENFAELMMVEELGYSRIAPLKPKEILKLVCLPTLKGFTCGFCAPLLPLVVFPLQIKSKMLISLCLIFGTTVLLGAAQTSVSLGAYANSKTYIKVIAFALSAIGVVLGASFGFFRFHFV